MQQHLFECVDKERQLRSNAKPPLQTGNLQVPAYKTNHNKVINPEFDEDWDDQEYAIQQNNTNHDNNNNNNSEIKQEKFDLDDNIVNIPKRGTGRGILCDKRLRPSNFHLQLNSFEKLIIFILNLRT